MREGDKITTGVAKSLNLETERRWGECRQLDAIFGSCVLNLKHFHALAIYHPCVEMVVDDATLLGGYWRLPWLWVEPMRFLLIATVAATDRRSVNAGFRV